MENVDDEVNHSKKLYIMSQLYHLDFVILTRGKLHVLKIQAMPLEKDESCIGLGVS